MFISRARIAVVAVAGLALASGLYAQDISQIKVEATPLGNNVYMLEGAGGNLGLLVGDDGALLVDSEYGQLHDKVLAAIKAVTDKPMRLLINTHWHFDHVGGNESFAKAGALIIAQENVRQRMSTEQYLRPMDRRIPPSPAAALPAITYGEQMTLYRNGEEVQLMHAAPAHTDGDTIVHFRKANVIHAGDIVFAGMYPFIDVGAHGSIDGMIAGVDRILALANDETKIIPGHGPLCTAKNLRAYRQMLATAREHIKKLIDAGKSRDEVIAAKPTHDLDAEFGQGGFSPDMWVGIVYDGLTQK